MKIDTSPRRLLSFSSAFQGESFFFQGLVASDDLPYEIWEGKDEYEMGKLKINDYLMANVIPVFIEYDGKKGKRCSEFSIEGWRKTGEFYTPKEESSYKTLCHIARLRRKTA